MMQKKNHNYQQSTERMRQQEEMMYRKNRPYVTVCGRSGEYITVCNGVTPIEIPADFHKEK